jgi:hypothetical protein
MILMPAKDLVGSLELKKEGDSMELYMRAKKWA